jgi:hypothetical protein
VTLSVPITVSSAAARSAAHLAELRTRREQHGQVSEAEQVGAEREAIAGAETLASRAKGSHGTEVAVTLGRVLDQIGVIQHSREVGYLAALDELNAKGLDKSADYGAFGQSLAGNLLWALSGLFPEAPLGALAVEGLQSFFRTKWTKPSAGWTAAIGTVGAMMSQFSSLPSGTATSALKIQMRQALSTINSEVCNALRRAAPELLASAIASSPPGKDSAAAAYAADLELGVRHALYGQIFTEGLADGDLVSGAKVQDSARVALLRQYIVANAALDGDGHVVGTKAMADQTQVGDALDLVGGAQNLKLQTYELIWNQVQTAAQDLGCTVAFDRDVVSKFLADGRSPTFEVTAYNPYHAFGGSSPTHWLNPLHMNKIARPSPTFDNEAYLSTGNVPSITQVMVHHDDVRHAVIGGKPIYSADRVHFLCKGVPSKGFISVSPPAYFDIVYEIAP